MRLVVASNNSHKSITNTAWVRARLFKLEKGCTRLAAASDNVYQLLAHGRWFSPGTPASSTTKTGHHAIDCHTHKLLETITLINDLLCIFLTMLLYILRPVESKCM